MKRVFIALKVEPDENLRKIYSALRYLLENEKITWVDPSNIHLTLAFLGDTQDDMIKAAGTVLKEKCSDFGEFIFNLKGIGVFKSLQNPRVIWTGTEQSENLIKLYDNIIIGLKSIGFLIEDRPFRPHITRGRIKLLKNTDVLRSAVTKYQDTFIQQIQVTEVILYESILKPAGPLYIPVYKIRLNVF